jgi:uncharacterized protein with ATP-grasp and redox domains
LSSALYREAPKDGGRAMFIEPDCIPCILKMAISAMRRLTSAEKLIREVLCEILEIPSFRGLYWNTTSPEVIERVMEKITDAMDDPDPFFSLKVQQNQRMMELYPYLRNLLREAPDPLHLAIKLAILGNAIDLMIPDTSLEIEATIQERLEETRIPLERFLEFRKKLEESELLLYLGDNSGEIILDKLLIETIKEWRMRNGERDDLEVVFVVRSLPALNDVTLAEAKMVGMDKITPVLENGIDGPLPGTIASRCSSEVRDLLRRADLIISKGGGNFDTLEGEEQLDGNVTFLLLSKCVPYCNYFHTELYQPILANFFRK